MSNDIFYEMKNANLKKVKEVLKWANDNGARTEVTMLDIQKSWGRVASDKDFNTLLGLTDKDAAKFFRIVLRKEMNLFGRLTDEKVIDDVLEIFIRGIEADSKEYFISILLDKRFLDELRERYELKSV